MKHIRISDATMKQTAEDFRLSFKERIELAKLLDRLGVDLIELAGIENARIDTLQIKSIAAAVSESTVAVPVRLDRESVERTWSALQKAVHPRLQVVAAVSPVQIEYLFHKKPDAMLAAIRDTVAACRELCPDVEFVATDATRSEQEFLTEAMRTAIEAGASTVTLCDTAGTMLPAELEEFVRRQYEALPALSETVLGISCTDTLAMADACAIAAVGAGATQLRAAAYPLDTASLSSVSAFVEYPVLVFFPAGSPSFSKSTVPSCFGEFILNSSPA